MKKNSQVLYTASRDVRKFFYYREDVNVFIEAEVSWYGSVFIEVLIKEVRKTFYCSFRNFYYLIFVHHLFSQNPDYPHFMRYMTDMSY